MEVDLNNQVVRVLGSLPVKTMLDSLNQTGWDARLIGQGNPNGPCSFFIFFSMFSV
jgi:copper chaperone for superoxide dismutase